MRPFTQIILAIIFLFNFVRCTDEDVIQGLKIELVSTDKDLIETSEFDVGEDVRLMLKASNLTTQELDLSTLDLCPIMNDATFLVIYGYEGGKKKIGRALPEEEISCALLNINRMIPPNESIYLAGGNWFSNPNNSELASGNYFSNYTITVDGNDFYTSVEFQVK